MARLAGADVLRRASRLSQKVLFALLALVAVSAMALAVPQWIAFVGGRPISGIGVTLSANRGAVELGISPLLGGAILLTFSAIGAAVMLVVAVFVFSRRSAAPLAATVALTLLYGSSRVLISPVMAVDSDQAWLSSVVIAIDAVLIATVQYRFPDGRFVPRASIVALSLLVCLEAARVAAFFAASSVPDPIWIGELAFFASGVFAQVYRYRRVSTPGQRQQAKWVILGGWIILVALSTGLVQFVVPNAGVPGTAESFASLLVFTCVSAVGAAGASLAIAFGVLKYRLFEIDFVINRGALYGSAAILLVATFELLGAAAEQVLGPTLRDRLGFVQSVMALVILPAFLPLQQRLRPIVDRFLPATEPLALLFADIVASTEMAVSLGDERWQRKLASYYATLRRELHAHAGREVDTAGDGIFATFYRPTEAARCALALVPEVKELGLQTRIGLHYGTCDMRGEKPSGVNVIIAARVMAVAEANTVLVSSDCRDAIGPSDLVLEPLGDRALKGIPGAFALYQLTASS